jgi:hypothetical protein
LSLGAAGFTPLETPKRIAVWQRRQFNETPMLKYVEDVIGMPFDTALGLRDVLYCVAQVIHSQHVLIHVQRGLMDGQAGLSGHIAQGMSRLVVRSIDLSLMSHNKLPKHGLLCTRHVTVCIAINTLECSTQNDPFQWVLWALGKVVLFDLLICCCCTPIMHFHWSLLLFLFFW